MSRIAALLLRRCNRRSHIVAPSRQTIGAEDEEREMTLDPGGIIAWLVVGLIAGWLAGVLMKGGGYGVVGDIVVGLIGAFVGGIVFSLITGGGTAGFWGSIAVAFVGAVILIAIVRALPGRSPV
jgi:uncharacterized membrane protein YeaQ/YmgE (transglycosylase-associated protein family)